METATTNIPALATLLTPAQWDAALARYEQIQGVERKAKEALERARTAYDQARLEALSAEGQCAAARDELLDSPAPHLRALHWKLTWYLGAAPDGTTFPWSAEDVASVFADAARFASLDERAACDQLGS
ncbi:MULTISPECIES: hypothetical protein [Sphingomonas]|uniref:Uncharacterized protein n=1 Tax=Sphingomonas molluscorum TaxID=418184 RepID=A0ABU8Q7A1_9SPHN|nr:hypothetical protein [Sphingomonas sp. JUb134]MBM7406930.1 hypothetical protein [Sphingomonas sp. JUb134]